MRDHGFQGQGGSSGYLRGLSRPGTDAWFAENLHLRLTDAQCEKVIHWAKHPWNYLTGTDTNGEPIIWTTDEKDSAAPIKPFPNKEYLRRYVELIVNPPTPILLVDKSRQMYISTSTLLTIDTICKFQLSRKWLVSKSTEKEAQQMIEEKIRIPHSRLPEWVSKCFPIKMSPQKLIPYLATKSQVVAVAQNVAVRQARGVTATGILVDEASRQSEFGQIISAAMPMASQLIAVTTAEASNPGGLEFKRLMREGNQWRGCPFLKKKEGDNEEERSELEDTVFVSGGSFDSEG